MNRYSTPCTEEQTIKALELGAPIEIKTETIGFPSIAFGYHRNIHTLPTADEMIGWLRSQGFRFKIDELSNTIVAYRVTFGYWYKNGQSSNPKGATLAVIDTALAYLSYKKK